MDKSIETKLDTGVEFVKRIDLLRNIIIDVEGLREFSSLDCGSLDANGGIPFKKFRMHYSVTACAKQTRELFCEFFHIPAGCVPWQERTLLKTCRNSTLRNHMNSVLQICT